MTNQFPLVAVNTTSGQHLPCVVTTSERPDPCRVVVTVDETEVASGEGHDFELALQLLRTELEAKGLLLLCNRYRRNAFVSSMCRQMSGGLGCYLIKPRRPARTSQLADSLGPADASDVVSAEEADAYIKRWKAHPPLYILPMLVWENWRNRSRG